jgi:hypothetical protein
MYEPFVEFILGVRINNILAIRKWLPTVRAMFPMLRELWRHFEKGFLGAETLLYRLGSAILQYCDDPSSLLPGAGGVPERSF